MNVARPTEHALDARAAAPESDDGQIAHRRVARAFPVDDHGRAALEEGLPDEQLAAAGELADEKRHGRFYASCSSSAFSAAASPSSRLVFGLSRAFSAGTTPRPSRSVPVGVW